MYDRGGELVFGVSQPSNLLFYVFQSESHRQRYRMACSSSARHVNQSIRMYNVSCFFHDFAKHVFLMRQVIINASKIPYSYSLFSIAQTEGSTDCRGKTKAR